MKRWIAGLLVLLLLLCTCTACGSDKSADRSFFYPLTAQPKSLDPQICGDTDTAAVVSSMYEGLVRLGADGSVQPGVAQSMELSADGKQYTFHLREDARWHIIKNFSEIYGDGCEKNLELQVTAEDFVFTFQRIFSAVTNTPGADSLYMIRNAEAVHKGALTPLELGVSAVDAHTLVITLERPCAEFPALLTQPICVPCNRFFFESTKGKYGLGLAYTMCNGPFYLSKWTTDVNLFLRRNPDYANDYEVIPAAVYYYFNKDIGSYAKRVTEGNYDGAPIDRAYLDQLGSNVKTVQAADTVWGMAFNCNDPLLSNAYLRMALCSAFSAETMEMPDKTPAQGLLPTGCRIAGENYREKAGAVDPLEENEDRALLFMQFAAEALKTTSVSLTILCTEEYDVAMRKVIQRWQKVFGISVSASTQVCTEEELQAAQKSGEYQIAFLPVKAVSTSAALSLHHFTGEENRFTVDSTEYDGYIRAVLEAPTAASAVSCCRSAEAYLIRTGVFYPVFEDTSCFAFYGQTEGITVTPCGETVNFSTARKLD